MIQSPFVVIVVLTESRDRAAALRLPVSLLRWAALQSLKRPLDVCDAVAKII